MLFSMQILLFLYLLLALFLFISWTKIRNKALRLTSFCLSNKYTLYLAFNLTYCMLLMLYTNAVRVFLWCCTAWCISFPFLVYLPLAIYCFTTGKNWVFGNWVCLHIKIIFFSCESYEKCPAWRVSDSIFLCLFMLLYFISGYWFLMCCYT